ncbi:MAG: PilN domain-containing protein [Candidatus Paceibacterota bacterium]
MPNSSLNTSFIPKQNNGSGHSRKKTGFGLPLLGASLALLLVLGAWTGLELYHNYLEVEIEERKGEIDDERATLNTEAVDELLRADRRMKLADDILRRHIAPSNIFQELEDLTASGLRYTSLSYTGTPNGGATIELEGEAHNFGTVVTLADTFTASPFFSTAEFFDLNKSEEEGARGVTFAAELTVSAGDMRYTGESASEVLGVSDEESEEIGEGADGSVDDEVEDEAVDNNDEN